MLFYLLINEDGHFFHLSAYLISNYVINFILNIIKCLLWVRLEKTGIQPEGRVYYLVCFLADEALVRDPVQMSRGY